MNTEPTGTEYHINKTFLWHGKLYRQNEKLQQNPRDLDHDILDELQRLGLITKLRDVGEVQNTNPSNSPTSQNNIAEYKQVGFRFVQ